MRRKVWRCKICSATQEYSSQDVICKHCGTDLSMGPGEIIFLDDGPPETTPEKAPRERTKPGLLLPVVLTVTVVAAAVALVIWKPWSTWGDPSDITLGSTTKNTLVTTNSTESPSSEPAGSSKSGSARIPHPIIFMGENGEIETESRNSSTNYFSFSDITKEAAEYIKQEYLDLLTQEYPYAYVDSYSFTNNDGWTITEEAYSYTGSDTVGSFYFGTGYELYHFSISIEEKGGQCKLCFFISADIHLENSGKQTTYSAP